MRPTRPSGDAPVFAEPWQAEAFAMTVALHERGLFSLERMGGGAVGRGEAPDAAADGSDYYECWLRALEKLLAAKGVAGRARSTPGRRLAARRARHAARQADPAGERSEHRPAT